MVSLLGQKPRGGGGVKDGLPSQVTAQSVFPASVASQRCWGPSRSELLPRCVTRGHGYLSLCKRNQPWHTVNGPPHCATSAFSQIQVALTVLFRVVRDMRELLVPEELQREAPVRQAGSHVPSLPKGSRVARPEFKFLYEY